MVNALEKITVNERQVGKGLSVKRLSELIVKTESALLQKSESDIMAISKIIALRLLIVLDESMALLLESMNDNEIMDGQEIYETHLFEPTTVTMVLVKHLIIVNEMLCTSIAQKQLFEIE